MYADQLIAICSKIDFLVHSTELFLYVLFSIIEFLFAVWASFKKFELDGSFFEFLYSRNTFIVIILRLMFPAYLLSSHVEMYGYELWTRRWLYGYVGLLMISTVLLVFFFVGSLRAHRMKRGERV